MLFCKRCGSDQLAMTTVVDPNSGDVLEVLEEWCVSCDRETDFIQEDHADIPDPEFANIANEVFDAWEKMKHDPRCGCKKCFDFRVWMDSAILKAKNLGGMHLQWAEKASVFLALGMN